MHQIRFLEGRDFVAAAEKPRVPVEVIRAVAAVEARNSGFIKGTDLPMMLFEGITSTATPAGGTRGLPEPLLCEMDAGALQGRPRRVRPAGPGDPHPRGQPGAGAALGLVGDVPDHGVQPREGGLPDRRRLRQRDGGRRGRAAGRLRRFLGVTGLADELRSKDWADFARGYNGAGYKANKYDTSSPRPSRASGAPAGGGGGGTVEMERGDAVELQVALNAALGEALTEKLATDGWIGDKTTLAIRIFQRMHGMEDSGEIDAGLLRRSASAPRPRSRGRRDGAPLPHPVRRGDRHRVLPDARHQARRPERRRGGRGGDRHRRRRGRRAAGHRPEDHHRQGEGQSGGRGGAPLSVRAPEPAGARARSSRTGRTPGAIRRAPVPTAGRAATGCFSACPGASSPALSSPTSRRRTAR